MLVIMPLTDAGFFALGLIFSLAIMLVPRVSNFYYVTIAKWFTPNGRSIDKEGITPDELIEFTTEQYEAGLDPQFSRAVEILGATAD
jgi:C-terminal processing protease CtpA/Prc